MGLSEIERYLVDPAVLTIFDDFVEKELVNVDNLIIITIPDPAKVVIRHAKLSSVEIIGALEVLIDSLLEDIEIESGVPDEQSDEGIQSTEDE